MDPRNAPGGDLINCVPTEPRKTALRNVENELDEAEEIVCLLPRRTRGVRH